MRELLHLTVERGAQQYIQASVVFTASGDDATAHGRLVSLLIDTSGFEPGRSFALKLAASGIDADSTFILTGGDDLRADIDNGLVVLQDEEEDDGDDDDEDDEEDPPLHLVELTRKYRFIDADGQRVTLVFKGPGWGTLLFDLPFDGEQAHQDLRGIELHGTTLKTSLSIGTCGWGSQTSVGDITIAGAIGKLYAPTTDLAGDLRVDQAVRTLRLDDLLGHNSIIINAAGLAVDAKVKAAVRLDQAGPGASITSSKESLRSLRLGRWADGANLIAAPSITSLKVMGPFAGNVHLSGDAGPYVLRWATIRGSLLAGTWELGGNVLSLRVSGSSSAVLKADGEVRSLRAYSWPAGRIEADSVRSLVATGHARSGDAGHFAAGLDLRGAASGRTLHQAAVRGDISGSWGIAGDVGTIKARGAAADWDLQVGGSAKLIQAARLQRADLTVEDVLSSLRARQWEQGSLAAGSLGSMKLTGGLGTSGDLCDVQLLAGPAGQPADKAVGKVYVKGTVEETVMRIRGHAGSLNVGRLVGSDVLVGASAVTGCLGDFADGAGRSNQFRLGRLTIRGVKTQGGVSFVDQSRVAAWELGLVKYASRPGLLSGALQCHTLALVVNEPDLSASPLMRVWLV